ncbi:MAG: hypothetical protein E6I93_16045 [Chloroflexi bacterium]|nr:MAG: hypothetical protein E6I93_16045 [Chloroflexota bacterium]
MLSKGGYICWIWAILCAFWTFTGLRPGERLHETLVASDEELVSTVHDKIFSVVYTCGIPTPSTITQWMLSLDEALQSDRMAQLRDCLFEMVQVHELIAAN